LDKVGCVAGDLGLALFKLAKFEEAEGGPLATSSGEAGEEAVLTEGGEQGTSAFIVKSRGGRWGRGV
jgi:hypothetical protein